MISFTDRDHCLENANSKLRISLDNQWINEKNFKKGVVNQLLNNSQQQKEAQLAMAKGSPIQNFKLEEVKNRKSINKLSSNGNTIKDMVETSNKTRLDQAISHVMRSQT